MTTISDGVTTLTPQLVLGYEAKRRTRNSIHTVIGRSDPVASLKPAGLRFGRLSYLCLDLSAALALEQLHTATSTLQLVDTDHPAISMHYVPTGDLEVRLDDRTRRRWIVSTGFQEVIP